VYFVTAQNGNTAKYTVTVVAENIMGKWSRNDGMEIIIDGNIGAFSKITQGIWLTLLQEGKLSIGDPKIKNISKTGKLTWQGQDLLYDVQEDNLYWLDCSLTLNEVGNILNVNNGLGGYILTKIQ
jgi:uncharacterized protein (DUF2147 family)